MSTVELLTVDDLAEDGYYWIADKTDRTAEWELVWVERDNVVVLESEEWAEEETEEEEDLPIWFFGEHKSFEMDEEVMDYHVLIGPIPVPQVPVPFEAMNTVVQLAAPVPVQTLTKKVVELTPPQAIAVARIVPRSPDSEGGWAD